MKNEIQKYCFWLGIYMVVLSLITLSVWENIRDGYWDFDVHTWIITHKKSTESWKEFIVLISIASIFFWIATRHNRPMQKRFGGFFTILAIIFLLGSLRGCGMIFNDGIIDEDRIFDSFGWFMGGLAFFSVFGIIGMRFITGSWLPPVQKKV